MGLNVLLEHVFTNYKGRAEVETVIENILRFAQ